MQRLAEDAALLERALRQGWSKEHEDLRELLERRPDWVALLEGPEGVPDALGAEAEADRLLVDEVLALARRRDRPAAPRRRALRGPWLVAAALLVLASGLWWSGRGGPAGALDDDQELGSSSGTDSDVTLSCVRPEGPASDFSSFEWIAERPLQPDERYLLVVFSVDAQGSILGELARARPTAESWTPEPEDVARWPQRILWRVRRLTSGEARTGFAEALAER